MLTVNQLVSVEHWQESYVETDARHSAGLSRSCAEMLRCAALMSVGATPPFLPCLWSQRCWRKCTGTDLHGTHLPSG